MVVWCGGGVVVLYVEGGVVCNIYCISTPPFYLCTVMYAQSLWLLFVAPGGNLVGLLACRASVTPVVRPGTAAAVPSAPTGSSPDMLLPMGEAMYGVSTMYRLRPPVVEWLLGDANSMIPTYDTHIVTPHSHNSRP